jgi:pyruvate dehydrogenase E2 component (dihydrolipoamide acetyltransferase)
LKQFNSHFEKGVLKEYNIINIGLATDTERGLVVPVIKNAHKLGLNEIQESIKNLSDRAKANKLTESELTHSTFTITNLGKMRTDFFTPVLNPPEVAILGIGRIIKKPCVIDEDKIAIRDMAYLSLSYDHRVIDGADAARFLDLIVQYIEKPELK